MNTRAARRCFLVLVLLSALVSSCFGSPATEGTPAGGPPAGGPQPPSGSSSDPDPSTPSTPGSPSTPSTPTAPTGPGASPGKGAGSALKPALKWRLDTGDFVYSSPVVAYGVVYVGSRS